MSAMLLEATGKKMSAMLLEATGNKMSAMLLEATGKKCLRCCWRLLVENVCYAVRGYW
jgi:hypothetical protein